MKSEWVSAPAVTYKAHAHMTKDGLQPSDEYLGHLLAGQDLLRSCDEGAAYVDIIKGVAQRPSTIEAFEHTSCQPYTPYLRHTTLYMLNL